MAESLLRTRDSSRTRSPVMNCITRLGLRIRVGRPVREAESVQLLEHARQRGPLRNDAALEVIVGARPESGPGPGVVFGLRGGVTHPNPLGLVVAHQVAQPT